MDNEQPQPVTQTTSHVEEQPSQAEQTKRRQLDRDEDKRAELQRDMFTRIDDIRDQINRESDQRLERLEKKRKLSFQILRYLHVRKELDSINCLIAPHVNLSQLNRHSLSIKTMSSTASFGPKYSINRNNFNNSYL